VSRTIWHVIAAIALVALIPIVDWWALMSHRPLLGWLAVGVLLLIFMAVSGHGVVGMWRGILIDNRNVISLSRFQMVLWTAIVLSAFLTAALYNIYTGIDEPLAIQVPSQMWIMMGISTTSLVATPLLLSQKEVKPASPEALANTLELLQAQGSNPANTKVVGQVIGNINPTLARWSDMLTGDETSNGAHLDLSKLQMFFFTLLIAASYCAALWHMFKFAQADGISAFPGLDQSIIALIGISHSGYLLNKAVPRS
jgi:hypothetical protein